MAAIARPRGERARSSLAWCSCSAGADGGERATRREPRPRRLDSARRPAWLRGAASAGRRAVLVRSRARVLPARVPCVAEYLVEQRGNAYARAPRARLSSRSARAGSSSTSRRATVRLDARGRVIAARHGAARPAPLAAADVAARHRARLRRVAAFGELRRGVARSSTTCCSSRRALAARAPPRAHGRRPTTSRRRARRQRRGGGSALPAPPPRGEGLLADVFQAVEHVFSPSALVQRRGGPAARCAPTRPRRAAVRAARRRVAAERRARRRRARRAADAHADATDVLSRPRSAGGARSRSGRRARGAAAFFESTLGRAPALAESGGGGDGYGRGAAALRTPFSRSSGSPPRPPAPAPERRRRRDTWAPSRSSRRPRTASRSAARQRHRRGRARVRRRRRRARRRRAGRRRNGARHRGATAAGHSTRHQNKVNKRGAAAGGGGRGGGSTKATQPSAAAAAARLLRLNRETMLLGGSSAALERLLLGTAASPAQRVPWPGARAPIVYLGDHIVDAVVAAATRTRWRVVAIAAESAPRASADDDDDDGDLLEPACWGGRGAFLWAPDGIGLTHWSRVLCDHADLALGDLGELAALDPSSE